MVILSQFFVTACHGTVYLSIMVTDFVTNG